MNRTHHPVFAEYDLRFRAIRTDDLFRFRNHEPLAVAFGRQANKTRQELVEIGLSGKFPSLSFHSVSMLIFSLAARDRMS